MAAADRKIVINIEKEYSFGFKISPNQLDDNLKKWEKNIMRDGIL